MIKSVIWSSMIDYPDNVCTTLFTGVCNFDCEFCYNRGLLKEKEMNFEQDILPKLLDRKEFIDHVIISGGECTIHPDFEKIVNILYENGFKIGIHTNGYTPEILEKVIDKIDYVGMDVKNDFDNYNEITQKQVDVEKIKKSNMVKKINEGNMYWADCYVYDKKIVTTSDTDGRSYTSYYIKVTDKNYVVDKLVEVSKDTYYSETGKTLKLVILDETGKDIFDVI